MAIDSAPKRRGVAGINRWLSGPGITPDATPDAFWRQTSGRGYGGIAAGAPVIEEGFARKRRHFIKNMGRGMG